MTQATAGSAANGSPSHELDAPPWLRVETTLIGAANALRNAYDVRLAPLGLTLSLASLLAYLAPPMRLLLLVTLGLVLWTGALPMKISVAALAALWLPSLALNLSAGTALARDLVLTAAHCVARKRDYEVKAFQNGTSIGVRSIAVHPRFDFESYAASRATADVALIKLAGPLPDIIVPAALAAPRRVAVGETLTIAGSEQPARALMLRCTQLFNLTGHPALSMPCGTTSHGLPCGLQLVGRRFETDALIRVALAVETISSPVERTL